MLPPKLRLILGCLAFSDFFCCKKQKTLRWSNHFLKIQLEIHFFTFLNIDRNASKKILNRNMDILFSNLLSESILDFGKWSNGKYANMRVFGPYFYSNFFLWSVLMEGKKVKKWISHCILKK